MIPEIATEATPGSTERRVDLGPKVLVRTAETIRIACVKRRLTQGELIDWAFRRLAELAPGEIEAGS